MAKLGDGNFLAGASGAAVNELMQKELSKIKDPALHQWASAAVGAAVGGMTGGKHGAQSGASTAAMGTKENELNVLENAEREEMRKEIKNKTEALEYLNEIKEKYTAGDNLLEEKFRHVEPVDYMNDGTPIFLPQEVGYDINGNREFYIPRGKGKIGIRFSQPSSIAVPGCMKREIMNYDISKMKPGQIHSITTEVSAGMYSVSMSYSISSNGDIFQEIRIGLEANPLNKIMSKIPVLSKGGGSYLKSDYYIYNKNGEKIINNEVLKQSIRGINVSFGGNINGITKEKSLISGNILKAKNSGLTTTPISANIFYSVTEYVGKRGDAK